LYILEAPGYRTASKSFRNTILVSAFQHPPKISKATPWHTSLQGPLRPFQKRTNSDTFRRKNEPCSGRRNFFCLTMSAHTRIQSVKQRLQRCGLRSKHGHIPSTYRKIRHRKTRAQQGRKSDQPIDAGERLGTGIVRKLGIGPFGGYDNPNQLRLGQFAIYGARCTAPGMRPGGTATRATALLSQSAPAIAGRNAPA